MAADGVPDVRHGPGNLLTWNSRRRKAPSHHHELAHAIGRGAHHRRQLIREDGRQRRHVAGYVPNDLDQLTDRLLAFSDAIEIAHGAILAGDRTLFTREPTLI